MKMKKEDYMKLSKERLAELLVERDNEPTFIPYHINWPLMPPAEPNTLPCYAQGGVCTNPFHDCINCPRNGVTWTCKNNAYNTVTTTSTLDNDKQEK